MLKIKNMNVIEISQTLQAKIQHADVKCNEIAGYSANNIQCYIDKLLRDQKVEVGYRGMCGATHSTQKVFREWVKIVKALRKEGYNITEENVTHKNAYATNNGGFYNSIIYSIS